MENTVIHPPEQPRVVFGIAVVVFGDCRWRDRRWFLIPIGLWMLFKSMESGP